MIDKEVDIVINFNQAFIQFALEADYFITPTGACRIRGKMKHNEKLGFTVIISCELNSSLMLSLFIVFIGTKIKDARHSE